MSAGQRASEPATRTQGAEPAVAPAAVAPVSSTPIADGPASPRPDHRSEETTPPPPGKWNPTAERLLEAARRLLTQSGFNALSLEKIAREAGVNKPLVYYYFGNKAGLLRALMNSVLEKDVETLRAHYAALPDAEARVQAVIDYARRAAGDQATNQVFLDTAVNMLRHTRDRARLAEWCETCRQLNVWGLSADESQGQEPAGDILPLSAMTVALQDGLALQVLAEPEAVDTERVWKLWGEFLQTKMPDARPSE